MLYRVYSLRNSISGLHDGLFLFTNDEHANYELSRKCNDEQRRILTVCCVGEFDISTGEMKLIDEVSEFHLVDLSAGLPTQKSSISHASPEVQASQFAERTADIP